MSNLSENQIKLIADEVAKSNVASKELAEDLTDHILCLIEDDIESGETFETARERAFGIVFPEGITGDHSRSFFVLSNRKMQKRKSIIFILSYIGLLLIVTGFLFKALHLNGAGIMLIVSSAIFTFVFTPLFFLYLYKSRLARVLSNKTLYVFGFSGVVILLVSLVLRAFHWPGGGLAIVVGGLIVSILFLPTIFLGFYRATRNRTLHKPGEHKWFWLSAGIASSLFIMASLLKYNHMFGSAAVLITSLSVFAFGFLPLMLIKMYRNV